MSALAISSSLFLCHSNLQPADRFEKTRDLKWRAGMSHTDAHCAFELGPIMSMQIPRAVQSTASENAMFRRQAAGKNLTGDSFEHKAHDPHPLPLGVLQQPPVRSQAFDQLPEQLLQMMV